MVDTLLICRVQPVGSGMLDSPGLATATAGARGYFRILVASKWSSSQRLIGKRKCCSFYKLPSNTESHASSDIIVYASHARLWCQSWGTKPIWSSLTLLHHGGPGVLCCVRTMYLLPERCLACFLMCATHDSKAAAGATSC